MKREHFKAAASRSIDEGNRERQMTAGVLPRAAASPQSRLPHGEPAGVAGVAAVL